MFKALIFDMDGVIIDSEPLHFEVDKCVMRTFGKEIEDEVLNKYVGITNPQMWSELREIYCLEKTVDELIKMQTALKFEFLREYKGDAIKGIKELLREQKDKGIFMGIASSSPMAFIEAVLEKLNIYDYFNIVVSGEQVKAGKPEPDIFLKAAELLKVKPSECAVIEDSMHGVKAALAAGMKCIGFKNLNSGNQDLTAAHIVINNIFDADYERIKRLFE